MTKVSELLTRPPETRTVRVGDIVRNTESKDLVYLLLGGAHPTTYAVALTGPETNLKMCIVANSVLSKQFTVSYAFPEGWELLGNVGDSVCLK